MAYARQADRALPRTALYLMAAAAVAVTLVAIVALSMLGPLRFGSPATGDPGVDQALIEAGRQWELQRKAQAGIVDPVIESAREWERQRRQQSPSD